jgi:hypothetical protein
MSCPQVVAVVVLDDTISSALLRLLLSKTPSSCLVARLFRSIMNFANSNAAAFAASSSSSSSSVASTVPISQPKSRFLVATELLNELLLRPEVMGAMVQLVLKKSQEA